MVFGVIEEMRENGIETRRGMLNLMKDSSQCQVRNAAWEEPFE